MTGAEDRDGGGAAGDGGGRWSADEIARRRKAVLAALTLGVVVMVVFDHWFTLLLGIVLMIGSVVAGTFLVAVPGGFLDHDAPEDEEAAGVEGATAPASSVDPGKAPHGGRGRAGG